MDLISNVNTTLLNHVMIMSTPEEGLGRKTMFGAIHSSTDFTSLLSNVGGYSSSFANERIIVPYPDTATKLLEDGNIHELSAPYICAAIAGAASIQPVEQSLTRMQILNFIELKGIKMTRKQMNLLAEKGIMILTQIDGVGTPIEIRHGLTTDMSSIQTREDSICNIKDFASIYLKNIAKPYIGKYKINPELLTRMRMTLDTGIKNLERLGIIIGGQISSLYQDADNPDSLIVEIKLQVPYPCNYVNITLFID
jgi:hypothetical protein